jgi:pyruvate/2-oxoglutarate dehydrogenase complex dihydrolipoamide acyltransferase (E2) component
MIRIRRPTAHRKNSYYFLTRSQRYHAPCSTAVDYDVTPLFASLAASRNEGQPIGFTAALVKATSLVQAEFPRLNRHLFHGLLGRYEVEWEGVHCSLIVSRRQDDGEDVLVPIVLRHADRIPLEQIDAVIGDAKRKPLLELPEYRTLHKLRNLPRLARAGIAYLLRSQPRVHDKIIGGTYGLSAFSGKTTTPTSVGHALSPFGCTFFPGSVNDRPWVVNGSLAVRKIMTMTIVIDHYVLDGTDVANAMSYLGTLLAEPERLGLRPAVVVGQEEAA